MYEVAIAVMMLQCVNDDEDSDEDDSAVKKNRNRSRVNSNSSQIKRTREDVVSDLKNYISNDLLYGTTVEATAEATNDSKLEKMYKLLVPQWIIQNNHALEIDNYLKKSALNNKFSKPSLPVRGRRSSVAVRKEATHALVKDILQVINEKEETVEEELKALEDEDDRRLKEERFIEEAQRSMEGYLEKKSPAAHNRYQVLQVYFFYCIIVYRFLLETILQIDYKNYSKSR